MKSILRTASLAALLLLPAVASAQYPFGPYTQTVTTGYSTGFGSVSGGYGGMMGGCSGTIGCIASTVLYLINSVLVPLIFAVAFLMFIYGVAKSYIFSHGDSEAVKQGHQLILWGLIGFAVMISLWGLINVVANTFGLAGVGAPILPTSTSNAIIN